MTFTEKSNQLIDEAAIAVQILLGSDGSAEFVPVKPRAANEQMWEELKARWPGSGLRSIGFVGLVGGMPRVALKEELTTQQIDALASGFIAYCTVLLSAPQEPRQDEEWLARYYQRLYRSPYLN
jgi:hypothetical protein